MNWIWNKLFNFSFWIRKKRMKSSPRIDESIMSHRGERFRQLPEYEQIIDEIFAECIQQLQTMKHTVKCTEPNKQVSVSAVLNNILGDDLQILRAKVMYEKEHIPLQVLAKEVGMSRGKLTKELRKKGVTIRPRGKYKNQEK